MSTIPYIITTRRPCHTICACSGACISRRAVATLEEARDWAMTALDERMSVADWHAFADEVTMLRDIGGTIGPLPDGSPIGVEQKDERFFLDLLTGEDVTTVANGIAAYNAAQN